MSCSIIMEQYVSGTILSKPASFAIDNGSGSGLVDCREIFDRNNRLISIIQDNARASRPKKVSFVIEDNTNTDLRRHRRRRRSSRAKSSGSSSSVIVSPKPTQKSRWESESSPPSSSLPPKNINEILPLPKSMASMKTSSSSSCRWASGILHLLTSVDSSSYSSYDYSNSTRSVIENIKAALEIDLSVPVPQSSNPPRHQHQQQKQLQHRRATSRRSSLQNLSLPSPPQQLSARRTSSLASIPITKREGSRHLLVRPERIPSNECINNNGSSSRFANQRDSLEISSHNFRWGTETNTSLRPTTTTTTIAATTSTQLIQTTEDDLFRTYNKCDSKM
jgi:hypothetical protein